MPYDIFGFVETAPPSPGPWQAVFSVGDIVAQPDDFSARVFGLSKLARAQDAPYGHRGLPVGASLEVREWMACAARFEIETGSDCGYVDHTYASLDEIRHLDVPAGSIWHAVFAKIGELQRDRGLPDADVRLVLWANW